MTRKKDLKSSLRILYLEDEKNDVELAQTTLEEEGFRCDLTHVETRVDFISALEKDAFDIILADYKLPSFDGLSALAIAREKTPDVPFIFVSGAMGEELAIETLKNGATDYVLKQRISRLVPAIRRALEEAEEHLERRKAEEALEKLSRQNELILNSTGEGIIGLNLKGNHIFVNAAAAQMLGYRVRELIGKHSHEIWHHSKADGTFYPEAECPINSVCEYGIVRHVRDEVFWKKDGTSFPVTYACTPILEGGNLIGAVVTFRDITKRKREGEELRKHREHLKELVEERTAELRIANEHLKKEITEHKRTEEKLRKSETRYRIVADELARSNADLAQFATVASHDLQEPLRVVDGFIKLLRKRYKGKLDENADDFIKYTVDGIKRMQDLIKDLLEYSKVGSKDIHLTPVDFSLAVDKAVLNLKVAIEESGATVTHDKLPTLVADASQITRLFQNLIGNALKFRGKEKLTVHVSAERRDKEWTFSVRDNGIGIDPKAAERIFVIFQRLHTREEYPGTGIGLTICKRIVERHRGRIWVESEPGKGSNFRFVIPARAVSDIESYKRRHIRVKQEIPFDFTHRGGHFFANMMDMSEGGLSAKISGRPTVDANDVVELVIGDLRIKAKVIWMKIFSEHCLVGFQILHSSA
jgi:PAS domain S-box-containing protein